jgi:cardiolipin synthase
MMQSLWNLIATLGPATHWTAVVWWSLWFTHLLITASVALYCLRRRRDSSVTLVWIFTVWSLPLAGALLFVAFGINRVPRKSWHKHQSDRELRIFRQAREEETMPLAYWRAVHQRHQAEPPTPFGRTLNKAMNAVLPEYPLLDGNHIEPLVTGDEAFPRMLDAIRQAQHHIHLQTFILGNDQVGRQFLDLLTAKARSGIKVRLMVDAFGSTHARLGGLLRRYRNIPNFDLQAWTQVNPIKRQFQVNLRNHRKVLIVDGRVAFTGGLNLQQAHITSPAGAPQQDYHFHLAGPIVQELQYTFLQDWYFMTDEDPHHILTSDYFPSSEAAGKALLRVVNGSPTFENVETLTDVFFATITAANRTLTIVTPYLVPSREILHAIRATALRGVDTRLLVPRTNNHAYAGLAGQALYDELLSAGVHIFERRPPFLHAKALIADNEVAIIGTANMDVRSLRLNYETNLVVYDEPFIYNLNRIIARDMAQSDEIDLIRWRKRPARQQLLENFCNLLTPVL